MAVVTGALLANGIIEIYFSYLENKEALVALQQEKAQAAAARIETFVREIERQLGWVTPAPAVAGSAAVEQRRLDYLRLLKHVLPIDRGEPALTAPGASSSGSRGWPWMSPAARPDLSRDPRFTEAKAGRLYYGPVYFWKESEPYMTLAIAGGGKAGGGHGRGE